MTRRWLPWVVLTATTTLAGCPGSDTPAGGGTEGETETETDTEATGSTSSTTMTSASPTTNDTMTASDTATTTSTTTDPDTTATTTASDTTNGCPPGTEGCPCDIGSTCEGDLQCIEGTCVAEEPCDNPEGEPNDTEAEAVELDAAVCNEDATVVAGALDGVEDDWFSYEGESMFGCFSGGSPSATATSEQATLGVCIFVACTGGDPGNVSFCPMGLQSEDSPDGLPGCCGDDMASLSAQGHGCGFMNGDPIYLVRVSGGEDGACTAYDLAYDYTGF